MSNVYQFVPPQGKYEIIVLYDGGNDLYNGYHPSVATPQEVFERIESLGNTLITVAKKLYVIGISPGIPPKTEIESFEDHELIRHLAVNQRLANASKEARWNFRGLAEHVYSETHISDRDCVHLSEKGISQIRAILKTKVFTTITRSISNSKDTQTCTNAPQLVIASADHSSVIYKVSTYSPCSKSEIKELLSRNQLVFRFAAVQK